MLLSLLFFTMWIASPPNWGTSEGEGGIVNGYAGPQARAAAVSGRLGRVVSYIMLLLHPGRMVPALTTSAAHGVGD